MNEIHYVEKRGLKPREDSKATKLCETRIAEAESAASTYKPQEAVTENKKLKLTTSDHTFNATAQAEARLREAADFSDAAWQVKDGDVIEHRFIDGQGRPLEVRLMSKGDSTTDTGSDMRFYHLRSDGHKVGQLDLALEHNQRYDLQTDTFWKEYDRVKITYVEVHPPYRRAGAGSELLKVAEREARLYGAREIYGDPENEGARTFFEHNADQGWRVEDKPGYAYGQASKVLA